MRRTRLGDEAAADAPAWAGHWMQVRGRRGDETTGWGWRERIRFGEIFPLAHYASVHCALFFFILLGHASDWRVPSAAESWLWGHILASQLVSVAFPLGAVEMQGKVEAPVMEWCN